MRTEHARKLQLEAVRRHRKRYPERIRASRRRLYESRKRRAMELLGGATCENCGCDDLAFLEINHKGGGGCKEFRAIGNRITDNLLSGRRDTSGLSVLCRLCNALEFLSRKKPESAKQFSVRWLAASAHGGAASPQTSGAAIQ